MRIGIPKEIREGEKRVATTPEVAELIRKLGYEVAIESKAGLAANYSDEVYKEAGVEIIESTKELWEKSDIIFKVRPPETHPELAIDETELLHKNQVLISFIQPGINPELLKALAAQGGSVLSMDSVPRISRAQKMDALSSMANIAGLSSSSRSRATLWSFFHGTDYSCR